MFLSILYIVSAGVCIIFCLAIIIAQRILKLEYFILLYESYFTLLGVISLCFAIVFAFPIIPIYSDILVIVVILGLSCAHIVFKLVNHLSPIPLNKRKTWYVYGIITVLQLIAFVDLIGRFNLLFHVEDTIIYVHPFFKIAYIPFSIFGLTALARLVFKTCHSTPQKNRKLLKTFSYGMFCMLPFEYWDLMNCLIRKSLGSDTVCIYNFGVLIFAIFFSILIIQYIQGKLKLVNDNSFLSVRNTGGNEEIAYLEQIYQKIVSKIIAEKLFAEENISIETLSKKLNENRNEISKAVNMYFGNNFSSFINFFRVEEMKKQLAVQDQTFSILELGLHAGFKSKTSINRIFYKFTKMSPRDYRKKMLQGTPVDLTSAQISTEK